MTDDLDSDDIAFPTTHGPWLLFKAVETVFEPILAEAAILFSMCPVPVLAEVTVNDGQRYTVPFQQAQVRRHDEPVYVSSSTMFARFVQWFAGIFGDVYPTEIRNMKFHNRLRNDRRLEVKCELMVVTRERNAIIGEFRLAGVIRRGERIIPIVTLEFIVRRKAC